MDLAAAKAAVPPPISRNGTWDGTSGRAPGAAGDRLDSLLQIQQGKQPSPKEECVSRCLSHTDALWQTAPQTPFPPLPPQRTSPGPRCCFTPSCLPAQTELSDFSKGLFPSQICTAELNGSCRVLEQASSTALVRWVGLCFSPVRILRVIHKTSLKYRYLDSLLRGFKPYCAQVPPVQQTLKGFHFIN